MRQQGEAKLATLTLRELKAKAKAKGKAKATAYSAARLVGKVHKLRTLTDFFTPTEWTPSHQEVAATEHADTISAAEHGTADQGVL